MEYKVKQNTWWKVIIHDFTENETLINTHLKESVHVFPNLSWQIYQYIKKANNQGEKHWV